MLNVSLMLNKAGNLDTSLYINLFRKSYPTVFFEYWFKDEDILTNCT